MNIFKSEYIISCVKKSQFPTNNKYSFALVGRSNVGKSSFINALCNRKNLAYTSSKPGKTLTLNFYNINDSFYLVDFPGYGYAARAIEDRLAFGKMYEEFLIGNETLKICFLIIDLRIGPTDDDLLMYNYLQSLNVNTTIIATKADKLTKNELNKNILQCKKTLKIEDDKKFIVFSSLKKTGCSDVLSLIEEKIK